MDLTQAYPLIMPETFGAIASLFMMEKPEFGPPEVVAVFGHGFFDKLFAMYYHIIGFEVTFAVRAVSDDDESDDDESDDEEWDDEDSDDEDSDEEESDDGESENKKPNDKKGTDEKSKDKKGTDEKSNNKEPMMPLI
jgi:hypothetical protein